MKVLIISFISMLATNTFAFTSTTYTCVNSINNSKLTVALAGTTAHLEVKSPIQKTADCAVVGSISKDAENEINYINFACYDSNDLPGTVILALPSTYQYGKIFFSDFKDTELECSLSKH